MKELWENFASCARPTSEAVMRHQQQKCNSPLRTKSQAVLVVFGERVTRIGFTSFKRRFSAKIPRVANKLI